MSIQNAIGIPKELFVAKKDDRGPEHDSYLRVCSAVDIQKIKKDRTVSGLEYRTNSMVYVTDNIVDLEEAYPYIISLLQAMVDFYKTKTAALLGVEEVVLLS